MNIVIAGSGKVGTTLATRLSSEGYDITLIDSNQHVLEEICEHCDAMGVQGNCASMPVLLQAGIQEADLLIAATSMDEVNLLCCTTAHGINPKLHTIGRIRNPEYTQQIHALRNVFALSLAVNPEWQAAREVERLLRFPGFLRRDTFASSNNGHGHQHGQNQDNCYKYVAVALFVHKGETSGNNVCRYYTKSCHILQVADFAPTATYCHFRWKKVCFPRPNVVN